MSELRQLISLREVAKLHVKQWQEKAKIEAMDALFHEDPGTRADAMNRCNLRQGRHMEAMFWMDTITKALDEEQMSTTVDKQAEATAADNRVKSLTPVSRYCENCKKPMPVTHQTFKRDGSVIHVYHCDACGNDMNKQLCDIMHEEVERLEAQHKATAAAVVLGEEKRCS